MKRFSRKENVLAGKPLIVIPEKTHKCFQFYSCNDIKHVFTGLRNIIVQHDI